MIKRLSRIFAIFMIVVAFAFVLYSFNHPEASFPWSNTISYTIYIIYILGVILLLIAPFKK